MLDRTAIKIKELSNLTNKIIGGDCAGQQHAQHLDFSIGKMVCLDKEHNEIVHKKLLVDEVMKGMGNDPEAVELAKAVDWLNNYEV